MRAWAFGRNRHKQRVPKARHETPKFFLMGYILKFQNLIFMPLHKPLKKAKIRVDALPFTLYIVSVLQGEHQPYLYIFNMVTYIFST